MGNLSDFRLGRDEPRQTPRQQRLPFRVRIAKNAQDLIKAVDIRARAYERHGAPGVELVARPEAADERQDAVVLLAESLLDGTAVGSIRIQGNRLHPLGFIASLPRKMKFPHVREPAVWLTRLGVESGAAGRLVRAALAKASYQLCVAANVRYIFVTARHPVSLLYQEYEFDDLLNGEKIELPSAPGPGHSVLMLPTEEAEVRWKIRNQKIYDFMKATNHPDICLDLEFARERLGFIDH